MRSGMYCTADVTLRMQAVAICVNVVIYYEIENISVWRGESVCVNVRRNKYILEYFL